MSVVSAKQVSATRLRARASRRTCKVCGERVQVEKASIETAATTVQSPHPKQSSALQRLDILPALDLLVLDLELCLIPAALEDGEEAAKGPFMTPELAYEP